MGEPSSVFRHVNLALGANGSGCEKLFRVLSCGNLKDTGNENKTAIVLFAIGFAIFKFFCFTLDSSAYIS
jgi:hypothetical protein